MNPIEIMKQNSYKYANEKFNSLKKTFLEMSVIKSEFDIEKLTVKKQGNFIAHNYHFLIRQYSLALGEMRRYNIDLEEKKRRIAEFKILLDEGLKKTIDDKYIDLEIMRLENEIDSIELNLSNKIYSCEHFEKCRLKLIQLNGGKEPTNEDYQKEEPDYIKWFLEKEIYHDIVARQTGLRIGVIDNIDMLEENPLINPDFKRVIDKKMDLKKIEQSLEENKKIDNRNIKPELIEDILDRR